MKSKLPMNRIWQILYPLAVYYILYHLSFSLLDFVVGKKELRLLLLGISAGITLKYMLDIYRRLPIIRPETAFQKDTIGKELAYILAVVILGVVLNIIISNVIPAEYTKGFAKANETLYSGTLAIRILTTCLFIPALEEIVYRGIICGQLLVWSNRWTAIGISAFIFGAFHFNLVQFLYAFLMGIALGFVYSRCNKLWVVMAAHGLINFIVVIFNR